MLWCISDSFSILDFLQQFVDKKVGDGEYVPTELRMDTMIAVFFGAHHNTVNTLTWLIARLNEQRPPAVEILYAFTFFSSTILKGENF